MLSDLWNLFYDCLLLSKLYDILYRKKSNDIAFFFKEIRKRSVIFGLQKYEIVFLFWFEITLLK